MKRKIIEIDEEACTGCGDCVPGCVEGALQIIDGKARLIGDYLCDGLGACVGHCPSNAMKVIEREAEPYDERKVIEQIAKQGENTLRAHLEHLRDHDATEFLNEALAYLKENDIPNPMRAQPMEHVHEEKTACGCPGSMTQQFSVNDATIINNDAEQPSQLSQWPVQLMLLPTKAPFYDNADLLVAADCVPFAYANFHSKMLKGKTLIMGCPKLDDISHYQAKLTEIFRENDVKSINVVIMQVPCCSGMYSVIQTAIADSGKDIPLTKQVVGVKGNIL